jgi:hypothetical protein
MRSARFIYFLLIVTLSASCHAQKPNVELPLSFTVSVSNPLNIDRDEEAVLISAETIGKMMKDFNSRAFVVFDNEREIASQYIASDKENSGIVFILDNIKAKENRTITVRYKKTGTLQRTYPKRTQAELSHKTGGKWVGREYEGGKFVNVQKLNVPPEHKDHSWFIRYEGPGWESDKVGYRLYLDQRNATDVFGKTSAAMTLQNVGLDGFDSYHEMQPWGMDVMKVGKSLGIGSIGAWNKGKVMRVEKTDSLSCKILENGNLYSSFSTKYSGWNTGKQKVDLTSNTAIYAGSRLTHQTLLFNQNIDSICTGIVKDKNAKLFTSPGGNDSFGYIATYGKQSINSDNLGLAVFFNPATSRGFSSDAESNIVTLQPSAGKLKYYFMATWEKEPNGVTTEDGFLKEIGKVAVKLANPLVVAVKK